VRSSVVLIAVCLCALAAAPSRADTVTLTSSRDNTLYNDATGSLSNGAGPFMYAGLTTNGNVRRALVGFDLSSIPAGSIVTGVQLRLYLTRAASTNINVGLHRVEQNWGQGTSDAGDPGGGGAPTSTGDASWTDAIAGTSLWNRNGEPSPGGVFANDASATLIVGSSDQAYSWSSPSLIADVQRWVNAPATNFGWLIQGDEFNPGSAQRWSTRENAELGQRPTIIIEYTPVPSPGASGVLAMIGLMLTRRRRA
jgi:hypothetical protein